jgi:capsular polysaccharide transport system ATP-binding protein
MYGFLDCTTSIATGADRRTIFSGASLSFGAGDRIAVLGGPGSGKSMLQAMLAGRIRPDYGQVIPPRSTSWLVGKAGMLQPMLTGEQNVRTLAAMLDADPDRTSAFVALFSELGPDYSRPLRHYSGSMRARLAFSLSMAVPFPFYVADDTIGTGDPAFREKCTRMMERRLHTAGLFFTTSSVRLAERFAWRFAVIHERRLVECATIGEARALLEKAQDDDDFRTILAGLATA